VSLCVNPEFLREGSAIRDFDEPPFTIVGALDRGSEKILHQLYADFRSPFYVLGPEEAIMIKYVSNIYHALKVAFANEIGMLCKAHDIDSHKVMGVFSSDTKLNISPRYLIPGFAFGGSCLPKDIRAILYTARKTDTDLPLIQSILRSNDYLIERVLNRILAYGKQRVGLIGLSFKENTDDLRESPFVVLAEMLIGKGIELSIYDPQVSLSQLVGANRDFIGGRIPHVARYLVPSLEGLVETSELIVVGRRVDGLEKLSAIARESTVFMDFTNIPELRSAKINYDGIAW
jgi:GDP-mannose 6-dehydrogenase